MPNTVAPWCDQDLDDAAWLPPDARTHLRFLGSRTQAWTGRIHGQVVALAGITEIYPGMGEVWSYLTPEALAKPLWLHREVRRHFDAIAPSYHRIQASTDAAHDAGRRWLEALGFVLECRKFLAGPHGETMLNYVCFPRGVE